jgi:hypothetical protein
MDTLSFKKLIIKSKNNNNKNNTLTRIKSVKQHYNTQNKIKIQIKSVKQHYDTQTPKKPKNNHKVSNNTTKHSQNPYTKT